MRFESGYEKVIAEYEYFKICEKIISGRKTPIYRIYAHTGSYLGEIKWFGSWRKFCFYPVSETVWETKCLNDLIGCLNDINKLWKDNKNVETV